jgi:hypothetical protein
MEIVMTCFRELRFVSCVMTYQSSIYSVRIYAVRLHKQLTDCSLKFIRFQNSES